MRRFLPLVMSAFCVTLLSPALGAQRGREVAQIGLAVYADANFQGVNATFIEDMADLRSTGLHRRISSLRAAPGEIWQVCTEANFQGRCQVFSGEESNLQLNGWNDMIASARRVQGGGGRSGGGGGGRGSGVERGTLELFAGIRYAGQRVVVTEAVSNLRRLNFNDRAISLRVAPGDEWEVCVNADYDDCRIVDSDMPELTGIGLHRQISSVRPRPFGGRGPGRGGRGGGAGNQPHMILYDLPNYRGQVFVITENTPQIQLTSNAAGSVRILSGRWELCVQPNYGGRCVTLTQDVPDLRRLSLPGRVSSARPR